MSRQRLLTLLRFAISAGLIALLAWRVDLRTVLGALAALDVPLFLLAVVLGHIDRVLQAAKWRLLLQSSGTRLSLGDAVANTYVGNFAGMFLPSGVGGDVVRVWLLRKMSLPTAEVVASILVERAFGVAALVLTACLAALIARALNLPIPPELPPALLAAALPLAILALASFRLGVGGLLAWVGRIGNRAQAGEKAQALTDAYRRYGKRKPTLLAYLLLSMIEIATVAAIFAIMAHAVGASVSFLAMLVVVPVILFVQRLPISINGIGVAEGTVTWFLVRLGETPETGVALAIALRLLEVATLSPGGVLWMKRKKSTDLEGERHAQS